ncbi:MAG: helix-turn-helix transcriptional regulator [Parvularculaceae bacterium]
MDTKRKDLSRFLRSARNRLNPEDFGITVTARRRTAGLRREEVATLAGISLTWYTWFEQGRDIRPSTEVLDNLSKVLRLDEKEREFLFHLAQGRPAPISGALHSEVSVSTRQLLDTIGVPALVIDENWTVIGWNRLMTRVLRDYSNIPPEDRNLFRILLMSQRYQADKTAYPKMVERLTARLKWDYSRMRERAFFDTLIEDMRGRCPIFNEYWESEEIADHFEASHSVDCPGVGRIDLHHTSYAIEGALGQRVVLYAPENEESRQRLNLVIDELRREDGKAA